ncbi:hypothetical protein JTE90_011476 [Oedothorax gibbosus]|uniref:Uncharacterized protein n=1 Tax=Oedothorax gibbosus TaxID=931172 RepID=A0AAV6VDX4_9ARAC|nr:hypothetical protein JTE90_011476 [Oedothorax gibbosus]
MELHATFPDGSEGKKALPSNNLGNIGVLDTPLTNSEKNYSKQSSGPIVMDSLISTFYPMEYTYPRANGERGNARVARSPYGSNLCRIPSLANSEVTCWKWPNWQTCKQTCIYGHGLDNGGKTVKEASFNCRNTENRWKPHVIKDCEPYLNCKVHLKSPGDLNCVEPTDGPAYCDINCADYDDYVGHGKVRWKCEEKPHGAKQNHLPHCAEFEEAELRLNPPH